MLPLSAVTRSSTTVGLEWSITVSAPSDLTYSKLRFDAVDTTLRPEATASWIAELPTEELPPQIRMLELLDLGLVLGYGKASRNFSYSPAAAVDKLSGITLASSNSNTAETRHPGSWLS